MGGSEKGCTLLQVITVLANATFCPSGFVRHRLFLLKNIKEVKSMIERVKRERK